MATPDVRKVEMADLRWSVIIAKRNQAAASSGGMQETLTEIITVRADIQPAGAMTFYGAAQIDSPVTHKVRLRWLDWIDTTHVIIRDTLRPDGTTRREIFRIRRMLELNGRKRFLELDVEQEKRT